MIRALLILVTLGIALSGCASYTTSLRDAQAAVRSGRVESAMEVVNERLDVDEAAALPDSLRKNRVLLLLERATLLQALGEYELAARDMMIADQRLDWLDLDGAGSVDVAEYLYSGSATPYRAPAYERLLLNTLNMINFMAMRDFEDARVEARRFQIIAQFLIDDGGESIAPQLLAAGNYLGGVAFEASREYDVAVRYYARAWAYGYRNHAFRTQLVDLVRVTAWSGAGVPYVGDDIDEMLAEAKSRGPMSSRQYRARHVDGQLLVVAQTGLVPYKIPERIPIGAALTWHTTYYHHYPRHGLSTSQRAEAHRLVAAGVLKWVNFPVLSHVGLPRHRGARLSIDDSAVELALLSDVADQVERAYQSVAGALIGAAISRMIVRAVAGGATRAGSRALAQSRNQPAIGVLGWLAGLAVEGAMTAADVPDTRSWTTAPGQLWIARRKLPPGQHRVAVEVGGRREERAATISPDSLRVVNFSRYR